MHAAASAHVAAAETATVASAKAGMTARAAGMSPAATMASAMLRPQGYRQEKRERRNRHQTPHMSLLYARIASNQALTHSRADHLALQF